ncbi:uracil-DNA glycosylase [bacterium]|nr:MAG: uracil-DNA glycosylase [bacterium]
MTELFADIRRFILEELQLFGDVLLVEEHAPDPCPPAPEEITMPRRKKAAVKGEEPVLFEETKARTPEEPKEAWENARTLDELEEMIHDCTKCDLWKARTNFVFGTGNPHATFMVVGEAPGADEDAQGKPFVGRAGQLLNKILEAIHFKREDVYIANILKSRPPGNRKPAPEEVEACLPYLKKQVELIKPKVILCLGLTAAENLLGTTEGLGRLRGRVLDYEGIPVMVTYHPAALLRNPAWKRPTWEDVQAARALHDKQLGKK